MSVEELINEIKISKQKEKERLEKIKYISNKNAEKLTEGDFQLKLPKILTKDEIYSELKRRYRFSWKSKLHILNNFLTILKISRSWGFK